MSDPIGALVAAALADDATTALVGAHGYGSELPAAAAELMPMRCFVIAPSGGVNLFGGSEIEARTICVDLKAYAATSGEADQARDFVGRRLRSIKRAVFAGPLIPGVPFPGGFPPPGDRDGQRPQP